MQKTVAMAALVIRLQQLADAASCEPNHLYCMSPLGWGGVSVPMQRS